MRIAPAVCLASLLLASAACDKSKLLAPDVSLVISLTAPDPVTILADGVSRSTIIATMDKDTVAANRTVTFTTSKGTLIGQKKDANGGVLVEIDGSGRAVVQLQSDRSAGTAFVQAASGTYSATTSVAFTALAAELVIQISPSTASSPADGASVVPFTASVKPGWLEADRKVTFTTSAGTFDGTNVTATPVADANGVVTIDVRSPRAAGTAIVTAAAGGVSRSATLTFTRALPDRLLVNSAVAFLGASTAHKTTVTVKLARDIGTVTDGTVVTFAAFDESGIKVGAFSGITDSANGTVTADFSIGSTTYRSTVTIIATVSGTSMTGSVQIRIIDP